MIPSKKQAYTAMKEKVQTIKRGMTKDEVKKMMGEPSEIGELKIGEKSKEIWKYPISTATGEYCYCEFDNDAVIDVMNEKVYKGLKIYEVMQKVSDKVTK
jgi:hypothetical protein